MAEAVRVKEPQNTLKHTVILSLYNTCMCYLMNRELGSPMQTSKTPNVNKKDVLDLDLVQLDKVTEEIYKTKSDDEAQQKISELFDGDLRKPSRNIDLFLTKNQDNIGEMGSRIDQILHMNPKQAFAKWNKLSELSLKKFGSTVNVDEKNPLNPQIAQQMFEMVSRHCDKERSLEEWIAGDDRINIVSFSTCTTSVVCAKQIQKCFNYDSVDVDFYQCISSDKDLMKCTKNIIGVDL
ncbi:predicted protein [Naegleria gruberi]|uniref:Predicted protein n=1 Tax=Naegleria gruberi TaxID=5762 RepID=D2VVR7_NAEGR|nr:uncharacterized protein NAEGRDRAFT_73117 [Naegleria gruberi]EFC39154.1 predicted protein [Naegleria gruberi]|eukprot:XP_002671898.1 predicted protein [Naegleria gruberi strain NEG-M]